MVLVGPGEGGSKGGAWDWVWAFLQEPWAQYSWCWPPRVQYETWSGRAGVGGRPEATVLAVRWTMTSGNGE